MWAQAGRIRAPRRSGGRAAVRALLHKREVGVEQAGTAKTGAGGACRTALGHGHLLRDELEAATTDACGTTHYEWSVWDVERSRYVRATRARCKHGAGGIGGYGRADH